jgi:hypothetical protein
VAYFSQLKGFRLRRAGAENLDLNERIIAKALTEASDYCRQADFPVPILIGIERIDD